MKYVPKAIRLVEEGVRFCKRCIYDETVSKISFDEEGICNYCRMIEEMTDEYKTGTDEGEQKFADIVEMIKRDGKGKKYDCVIGVSGGTDSSYLVDRIVKDGLRPLAVNYDNTWSTAIATENIRKVLGKLNVDLYTHVVDNKEMDDIFRSFFEASVPDIDAATDLGYAETLRRVASKFKVKYILEGHSFKAEGISPLGFNYFDGQYIKSVHKQFGKLPMKTYPLMDFWSFMKWTLVKRIQFIRPLWYIRYDKDSARSYLEETYNWEYYGGHHLENRMTAFWQAYYGPVKFDLDQRSNSLGASARSGLLTHQEALDEYKEAPAYDEELLSYFRKRLQLTEEQFQEIMERPTKSFRDFKTYKQRFERLRPLFYILAKRNLVPWSFYRKYTSKEEIS